MTDAVRRENVQRDIRHGMKGESAARCIGKITKGAEIFGITKGDFSMIDILRHVAKEIGPCHCCIGTWTAARAEIKQAWDMLDDKNLLSVKFLVDRSFPQRQPEYYEALLKKFGRDAVRMARFHAKFILLENENFSVAVVTSMNLNLNARIEFYQISEGTPISDYLRHIVDYHFALPMEDSYSAFTDFDMPEEKKAPAPAETQRIGNW